MKYLENASFEYRYFSASRVLKKDRGTVKKRKTSAMLLRAHPMGQIKICKSAKSERLPEFMAGLQWPLENCQRTTYTWGCSTTGERQ